MTPSPETLIEYDKIQATCPECGFSNDVKVLRGFTLKVTCGCGAVCVLVTKKELK